jgi:hypothetical protein
MAPVASLGSRRGSVWTGGRREVGRAAAMEAADLALVETAPAHDVGRALVTAGVGRVRDAVGSGGTSRSV